MPYSRRVTFELPDGALRSPSRPPLDDLSRVDPAAATVAVMGAAKRLERLAALPALERLWISGVSAKAAEVVATLASLRQLTLYDVRLDDLRWLARLGALRSLAIAEGPRLARLDGIEALSALRTLVLYDVRVRDLGPIGALRELETLSIDAAIGERDLRVPTLAPLAGLSGLVRLRLAGVRAEDGSLAPLHGLRAVRDVFIGDTYPPPELRALALALPDASGEWLDTYRREPDAPRGRRPGRG
jgi:hypothetical protein